MSRYKYDLEFHFNGYGVVCAYGDDLESVLETATVGLESQHGEDAYVNMGDLPVGDYEELLQILIEKVSKK
jgi:hypothetical protein